VEQLRQKHNQRSRSRQLKHNKRRKKPSRMMKMTVGFLMTSSEQTVLRPLSSESDSSENRKVEVELNHAFKEVN